MPYKDSCFATTKIRFSFWDRVQNLFVPEIEVTHILNLPDSEMPKHEVEFKIYGESYFSKLKHYFRKKESFAEISN